MLNMDLNMCKNVQGRWILFSSLQTIKIQKSYDYYLWKSCIKINVNFDILTFDNVKGLNLEYQYHLQQIIQQSEK